MELVVDANILFSALIKNSTTAELLFNEELKLYTSEFIIEEFFKYEGVILQKTSRTREEFIQIMHQLKEIITVIQQDDYNPYIKEAEVLSPDEKDIMYLALALKLNCPLWSNDKKLKQQNKINILNTAEILQLL